MKIKVSLNKNGFNKTNTTRLTFGWKNQWLEPFDLAAWVTQGRAWSGTHFSEGKRCQANASGSNAIVFDFDGELSLAAFWATKVAQDWCCLTYTSASSTEEINRFRAVFPLAGIPLASAWEHRCVYQWLEIQLSREVGMEFKDDCGQKPERLWFGNTEAEVKINDDACIPADIVAGIEIPDEPVFSSSGSGDITDIDVKRCIWLLDNFIATSEDGRYNEDFVPVTAACAAIGSQIEEAWVNWVARGHHGEKPSNMDARLKWRGLGQKSGPSSLYAIAKRQDPNWTRALPPELRFRPSNDFAPDLDTILAQQMLCVPRQMFTKR